jgi:hypothetical protein
VGDCSDELEDVLHAAQDQSAVGRRLHSGASVQAAVPADADRLELVVEYSVTMLAGVEQALRTLAFEIDELNALHHRLATAVDRLSAEIAALREST